VLFGGAAALQDALLHALEATPAALPTIEAVRTAVEALSALMHGRHALARERQRIVAAHADLQERDMIKRASLTAALAQGLQRRGVAEPTANIAADMGIGAFYVGFGRWLDGPDERELTAIVRESFDQLKAVASGSRT
jgi:hypothetical protein